MDRMEWMRYPGGNGGQAGETVSTTYNLQGLANSVYGTSSCVQGAAYDALERVDLLQLGTTPSVKQIDYVYCPWTTVHGQVRLKQIKTGAAGTPTEVQNLQYTYDAVGNVLSVGDYLERTGASSTMVKYYSAGSQRVAMRVGWERRAPARPPSGSTAPSAHSSRSGDYVKPPR
jgi:hypothetical protein